MSHFTDPLWSPSWGRRTFRASVAAHPLLSPVSMAGEPHWTRSVRTGPPQSARPTRVGSVLIRSPGWLRLHELPLSRLCPSDTILPMQFTPALWRSVFLSFGAAAVGRTTMLATDPVSPPMLTLVRVSVAFDASTNPPARSPPMLSAMVTFVIFSGYVEAPAW